MRRTRVRGVPLSGETLGVDNLYPNDILGLVISTDSSSPDIWSLITSDVELTATCERWSVAGIIGVDTEFVRERTYYPCPALIQVADNHGVVIIDPLGISDFSPLKDVLIDPSILKLTHACDEDLEVLELLTGVTACNVFDTQLAGAFAGYGFSLGYRNLVEVLLEVVLEKDETRSDWLKRPLSSSQLRYAALDVVYLLPMHERLSREMTALGRSAWFKEEFEHRRRARAVDKLPEAAYLRIRGRGALRPAQRAVLRALCQWRETEAMARDIPRRHLLRDEVLLKLASDLVIDASSLGDIDGLSERTRIRYGQALLTCIGSARTETPTNTDALVNLQPYAGQMKRWKEIARTVADAHNLPPELLANRRALEELLISVMKNQGRVPTTFQGWRFEIITETLLNGIQNSNG
jgi:ribonuclease D